MKLGIRRLRAPRWVAALAGALLAAAHAQTPLYSSADVTTTLGPVTFADEAVIVDDLSGVPAAVSAVDLGALPGTADVKAFHLEASGDRLFALDTTATLPGGLVAEPRDVVRYDGATYALEFDGSSHGVPADVRIDAVTRSASGDLVLPFDTNVDFAADEDLVRFDGSGFQPYFDGSAAGVPGTLDLDAAHRLPNDHLLLSFDGTGTFPGFGFADEDVLEYDPTTGSWQLFYDASAAATPWPGSSNLDAVALPEPSPLLALATALSLLAGLARLARKG
jgi:hypothetical protein